MQLLLQIFYGVFGIAALYYGAEGLVKGGASLARKLGISSLVIGLTLVACGTSMPEFVVSVSAALTGTSDISLGNIVGSNICNIALILGASGCVAPMLVDKQVFYRDVPVMLLSVFLLCAFYFMNHGIERWQAAVMLVVFIAYMLYLLYQARKNADTDTEEYKILPTWQSLLYAILGIAGLVIGARAFLSCAIFFAKMAGISDAVIGLTVVAVGTSLPELATSFVAALRKENDIAIGNVVGSNIFNVLMILGIVPLIRPLRDCAISLVDMSVMVALSIIVLINMRTGWKITRAEAVVLLLIYIGYIGYLASTCC